MKGVWPAGDPRDVVHAILAKPPFGSPEETPPYDPWAAVLRWLGERLQPLFAAIGHALGAEARYAPLIGGLVAGAFVVGVAAVSMIIVERRLRRTARPPAARRALHPRAGRDSAAWLAFAAASARAERWRDACGALLQAALTGAAETDRLPYDGTRTAAEAARALSDPAFDALAGDAQTALFAAGGADEPRFERMRAAYARFERS